MKTIAKTCALVSLLAGASLAHAGSHTWSGAVNNSWSNAGNWSAGGAPQFGEANLTLIFPANAVRYAATNGVGNFTIDAITIEGSNYSLGGYGVTLTANAYLNLVSKGTNNLIALPLTFNSALEYIQVDTYASLTLAGTLTGPGGFYKFGRGTLRLSGTGENSYGSPTVVREGFVEMAKPPFTTAIPTALSIGYPDANYYFVEVSNESDHQIPDTVDVTVNKSCYFYLKGHSEVINSLHLSEAIVATDIVSPATAGQLTIWGGVTVTNSSTAASISGHLSLAGQVRTFDVAEGSTLDVYAQMVDGGQTAGVKKTGKGTLQLRGPSTYTGDTTVQNGTLRLLHGSALGTGAGSTYVQAGGTLSLGQVAVNNKHLYLNGAGFKPFFVSQTGALLADTVAATWGGPITLQAESLICAPTNVSLTLNAAIDGPGKLIKEGEGLVTLTGLSPNTFTGGAQVLRGKMALNKLPGVNSIVSPVTIGDPAASSGLATLWLTSSQQIQDNTPVRVERFGLFDLDDNSETIGALTLHEGAVYGGNGLLTLLGDVTAEYATGWLSFISGNLSLGGSTRTFDVEPDTALWIAAVISDGGNNAGLTKNGFGELTLNATNTYGGATLVNQGHLTLLSGATPGSTANGTTVAAGATLYLSDTKVGNETLIISGQGATNGNQWLPQAALLVHGSNYWGGGVVLAGDTTLNYLSYDTNQLVMPGGISGAGGLIIGGTNELNGSEIQGTLSFVGNAPNIYIGTTVLKSGLLQLSKTNAVAIAGPLIIGDNLGGDSADIVKLLRPDQIADNAPVTIQSSGLLLFDLLNAPSETIGSLAGPGRVSLNLSSLTVGGNNTDTEFSGSIGGVFLGTALTKIGTGKLTLSGTNTYQGKTVVDDGYLFVNGVVPTAMQVNGNGHLHGHGSVKAMSGVGGWTAPGNSLSAPVHGVMKSDALLLDQNSHFQIDLGGSPASGEYDRIKVTGQVNLGNATLHLTQSVAGHTNDQFMIIENHGVDPIAGQFVGYQEGSLITLNGSQVFEITYQGGDGNDVVLTQKSVPAPPSMGPITPVGGGQMQISGTGIPGVVYTVEATEDLGNPNSWQEIGTATADQNGAITFIDADAPNHVMRFYRFKL